MNDKPIPPAVTDEERWLADRYIEQVRVEYAMTGTDTSDTYVVLRSGDGQTRRWSDTTFNRIAELRLDHIGIARAKREVRERVEARVAWERQNARDLATYKRLKARFDP